MISTSDFHVSAAGDCTPLSLILPCETGELAMLGAGQCRGDRPRLF